MLDGDVHDSVEATALSLSPQHIHIYSASWGPEDDGRTVDGPGILAAKAFIDGVTTVNPSINQSLDQNENKGFHNCKNSATFRSFVCMANQSIKHSSSIRYPAIFLRAINWSFELPSAKSVMSIWKFFPLWTKEDSEWNKLHNNPNNCWIFATNQLWFSEYSATIFQKCVTHTELFSQGRKGLGSVYVWASGNGGKNDDSCSCDGYANSVYTISVSSAAQDGSKPWYLEECASTLTTTFSSGNSWQQSIVTTDLNTPGNR